MRILMTGATGLIGRDLGIELVRRGHELLVVSRNAKKATLDLPFPCQVIEGDLVQGKIADPRFANAEGIIHLMGESVAEGRWTEAKKKRIFQSRVEATANLRESLKLAGNRSLRVLVSTSATGFYGERGEEELTESSQTGTGFLAGVCQAWEREAFSFLDERPDMRLAVLRLGVVLTPFGGALEKMRVPFQTGVGAPLGDGRQWMSWIHLEDVVRVFAWAVENENAEGIFNAVSPAPARNIELSRRLAEIFSKHLLPPVPPIALKALLGEVSEALLGSAKVLPEQLLKQDFQFRFPDLGSVLAEAAGFFADGDTIMRVRQYLPVAREKIFPFFSEARNLESITPPFLNFAIEKMSTPKIGDGTLIDYRLKLHGLPIKWTTKIENWRPDESFVDIQLKGPYRKWHHTHLFEKLGAGTLITDLVRYRVPLGILGKATAGWKVGRDVEKIFEFRRETLSRYDFAKSDSSRSAKF